jgi:hypothetical protein
MVFLFGNLKHDFAGSDLAPGVWAGRLDGWLSSRKIPPGNSQEMHPRSHQQTHEQTAASINTSG